MNITIGRGRKRLLLGILSLALIVGIGVPPAASAAPSDSPTSAATSDFTVADILRMNPKARQIAPNAVRVAPNVEVVLPAAGEVSALATGMTTAQCSYKYVCLYEGALGPGLYGGVVLRITNCGSYNLGHYSFPDFRYVGTAAGPKWNDRISAVIDNQTSAAAYPVFYNWEGSWKFKLSLGHQVFAPYVGDDQNDMYDRVDVC
ncbi:hypothetical protein [Actinoplanes aureus]|uniref:Peptidase inhibitor family I36 n=1 Tax=Actinoplanes aureus TaxID=2792083 RepID=A0A931FZ97_9ACTN|nr:hypothetical protein [Actinoplanes aureus]MBG0565468.1 hypothetical protein [Actinoplanes aureus]